MLDKTHQVLVLTCIHSTLVYHHTVEPLCNVDTLGPVYSVLNIEFFMCYVLSMESPQREAPLYEVYPPAQQTKFMVGILL